MQLGCGRRDAVVACGQLNSWAVDKPQHDVLFTNQLGVVVPAGVVDEILKRVKPIATYPRKGNLYCAKMTTSGFPRQGPAQ